MPVTIIALESARVLGFLVGHPARRLLTGPVSHPVVKVAARSAHGACREVAPPTSPLPGGGSAAGGIRSQLQLLLRHVAVDPHHVVTAHDRIHRIGLARERLRSAPTPTRRAARTRAAGPAAPLDPARRPRCG